MKKRNWEEILQYASNQPEDLYTEDFFNLLIEIIKNSFGSEKSNNFIRRKKEEVVTLDSNELNTDKDIKKFEKNITIKLLEEILPN